MQVHLHESLNSTNDEARRLALEGAPHGTAVCARQQTAGRGRHGRHWQSPPGNLYVSVLLRGAEPARMPELAFVAGLAVADAVAAFLPQGPAPMLKWPNDILLGGAKLAGILLEAGSDPAPGWLIVGIGVNVAWSPAGLPYPTTCLSQHGAACAAVDDVLPRVLASLATHLARWEAEGFTPIRADWLRRAHPSGHPVEVRLGDQIIAGCFAGLGGDGALLVRTGDGVRRFVAGDVLMG